MGHSVAVLSNGDVFGWGGARKGQLGDSLKGRKIVWSPTKVEGIPFRATGAVCGREFTVVFGRREAGEFVVLGDRANRWGVMDVPSLNGRGYKDIGASWHDIYVHVVQGAEKSASLVAWGRNDRGQLPPPGLPEPVKIAVGSEHVLALLDGGEAVTFGWGEHGNCGPDTDESGNVSGTYNVVSLPDSVRVGAKIVGVGAGCATSWLIVE
jgi:protein ATS1